ncbi:hypothetical protein [Aquabacterium sp. OR-4]|uniref:hypothetical protein n=1 Tax=Aquabacterium sp. OR-4 TaxID=2978127 RepID=UPI0021B3DE18|nr:hypothetical protein [Aquabacterium sp. OR-4]MDT7834906.1 hypothetical protein [Aquabacterium sp. OR-4]
MLQRQATAPRQFMPDAADTLAPTALGLLPDAGLPHDRHARIAARRSFVDIKLRFMAATALVDGPRGDWLRYQVRQTQAMLDLWLLRGVVFSALASEGRTTERAQNELQDALDSVFPNAGELLPYGVR